MFNVNFEYIKCYLQQLGKDISPGIVTKDAYYKRWQTLLLDLANKVTAHELIYHMKITTLELLLLYPYYIVSIIRIVTIVIILLSNHQKRDYSENRTVNIIFNIKSKTYFCIFQCNLVCIYIYIGWSILKISV